MDWKKFLFSFEGRISRKAYWIYFVVSLLLGIGLQVAAIGTGGFSMDPNAAPPSIPIWFWLVQIPLLWIGLAVMAKRWHDQDRSGWWTLLILIPFLGFLIVIIMLGFIGGTPGPNRFGDSQMA
jgi:uncharacterized membrane protein YhaH (DUF805 family)